MILALLLLASATAPPAPEISTERVAENHFWLTLSASGISSVGQGQELLGPTARKLCGRLPARFGAFRWRSEDRVPPASNEPEARSLRLEQELVCGEAPPRASSAAAAVGPDWKPTPAHDQSALSASYAYFAAKDEARYADAHSMLGEPMKQMSPLERWQEGARDFNESAGPVRTRRVVALTWYVNPPGADMPGAYAAADFRAEFEKLDSVCGYVVWLLQPDGSWRLVREEQNILDRESAAGADPASLARIRAQMGCKEAAP